MRRLLPPMLAALVVALGCTEDAPPETPGDADAPTADAGTPATGTSSASPSAGTVTGPVELGPVDGRDLPPADLERVAVGESAPDFSLASWRGDTLSLSEARGEKEILLVFYRGHW